MRERPFIDGMMDFTFLSIAQPNRSPEVTTLSVCFAGGALRNGGLYSPKPTDDSASQHKATWTPMAHPRIAQRAL